MATVGTQEYIINFKETGIKQVIGTLKAMNNAVTEITKNSKNVVDVEGNKKAIELLKNAYRDLFNEQDITHASERIKQVMSEVANETSKNKLEIISEENYNKSKERIEAIQKQLNTLNTANKRSTRQNIAADSVFKDANFKSIGKDFIKNNKEAYEKLTSGGTNEWKGVVNSKTLRANEKYVQLLDEIIKRNTTLETQNNKSIDNLEKENIKLEDKVKNYERLNDAGINKTPSKVIDTVAKKGMDINYRGITDSKDIDSINKSMEEQSRQLDSLIKRYISWQAILRLVKQAAQELYKVTKELDDAFNGIAVVTNYTTKEVWNMYNSFLKIANSVGTSSSEITKIAQEYFKQGKSYEETLKLTEAAAISAKIAGISASDSINYLTSALNGYNLSANEALTVSDKFAKLASSSASDYEELATAMSKVAAQANASGVEMDTLMGFMTRALEVTREAPENIGTAFKTIFARMSEIKDYGKVLEDNTSANKVSKALDTIGISLFDTNGEMRDLDDVLIEVGYQWKNLNTVQQKYIATALAGTRQQTRLMAVFQDFDRTMELVKISEDSAGASLAQQAKTMEGIEYSVTRLNNAWQEFIQGLGSSELIKGVVNILTTLTESLTILPGKLVSLIAITGTFIILLGALNTQGSLMNKLLMALGTLGQFASTGVSSLSKGFGKLIGLIWTANKNLTKFITTETIGASITQTLSKVLDKTKKRVKDLNKAISAFTKSHPIIAAIALIATAIATVAFAAKKSREAITDLYSEIYDTKGKLDNIDELVSKYNELKNKLGKTNEELEEMKNLQSQIAEGSDNVISFNSNGDIVGYDTYIDTKEKELIKQYEKAYKDAKFTFFKREDATEIEKALLIMGETIKLNADEMDGAAKAAEKYYNTIKNGTEEEKKTLEAYTAIATEKATIYNKDSDMFKNKQYKGTIRQRSGYKQSLEKASDASFNKIAKQAATLAKDNASFADIKQLVDMQQFKDLTDEAQAMVIDAIASYNTDAKLINEVSMLLGTTFTEAIDKVENWIDTSKLSEDFMILIVDAFNSATNNLDIDNETLSNAIQKIFDATSDGKINLKQYNDALIECGINADQAAISTLSFANSLIELDSIDSDLASIRNAASDFESVNEALQNNNYNMDTLLALYQAYPEYVNQLSNDISKYGSIQANTIATIQKAEREEFIQSLVIQKQKLINQKNLIDNMLAEYQHLYECAATMNAVELQDEYEKTVAAYQAKLNTAVEYQQKLEDIENGNFSNIDLKVDISAINNNESRAKVREEIQSFINYYQSQSDSLAAQISAIETVYKGATTNANNFFTSTKESSKDYEKKLDSTYEATQRLAAATQALSKIDALKDLYENRNGLAYKELLNKEEQAIRDQSSAYKDLISAQESAQEILLGKYSAAVKSVFKFENGKLIPIMDKYNALSNENAKSADELVEKYNELSDGINDNTLALIENETKLKEIADTRRDMIINTQEILIEAIKAEQEARLKAAQDALDKEKELLEERKEIYQKAFEEEDYTNELEDTNKQREEIIKQLAALEGANDAKSKQKKIELQAELEELNKTYNDKVTEYNREALLEQIDDEIEANEKASDKLEEDYNKRIEDYAWLQEQIKILTDQGVEACLEYLKKWHDDYINGTTEMREKTEEEWRYAFEAVYGSTDAMDSATKTAMQNICGYVDNAIKKYEELATAINNAGSGDDQGSELRQKTVYVVNGKEYNTYKDAYNAVSGTGSERFITSKIKYYATGGYNNYTGLAMLHGTSSNPEAVLNAQDTKNFDQLKSILSSIQQTSGLSSLGGVSIDNITIQTNELNNTQDFAAAGKALGNSLQDILRQRGLVTNLKR